MLERRHRTYSTPLTYVFVAADIGKLKGNLYLTADQKEESQIWWAQTCHYYQPSVRISFVHRLVTSSARQWACRAVVDGMATSAGFYSRFCCYPNFAISQHSFLHTYGQTTVAGHDMPVVGGAVVRGDQMSAVRVW